MLYEYKFTNGFESFYLTSPGLQIACTWENLYLLLDWEAGVAFLQKDGSPLPAICKITGEDQSGSSQS